MSYSYKPKTVPCALPSGPKHKWLFIKNFTQKTGTISASGSSWRFSSKGFYRCECGATRVGMPKLNEPGADVRAQAGDGGTKP